MRLPVLTQQDDKMFETIWRLIFQANRLLQDNLLPAILAFMTAAVITAILRSQFGAL